MTKDEKSACDADTNSGEKLHQNQSIKLEDTDEYKETDRIISCRAYATVRFQHCDTNTSSGEKLYPNQSIKPEDTNEYKEMDKIFTCRTYAAVRLRRNEMWLQWISIYYSCFTAILALLSLREGSSFLNVPAAIFTVTVAMLVIFANAQKYGSRANDLAVNCNDMRMTLRRFKEALQNGEKEIVNDEYAKFIEQLADSEQHYPVDEYKYGCNQDGRKGKFNKFCWYSYLTLYTLFILCLFGIPVLFICVYWVQLLTLL